VCNNLAKRADAVRFSIAALALRALRVQGRGCRYRCLGNGIDRGRSKISRDVDVRLRNLDLQCGGQQTAQQQSQAPTRQGGLGL
jgi:hypothetical protein